MAFRRKPEELNVTVYTNKGEVRTLSINEAIQQITMGNCKAKGKKAFEIPAEWENKIKGRNGIQVIVDELADVEKPEEEEEIREDGSD